MNANAIENGTAAEEFITREELARRLRKSVATIKRWTRRDWLPYYRLGRSVRFKWSEVESALEQTRQCRSAGFPTCRIADIPVGKSGQIPNQPVGKPAIRQTGKSALQKRRSQFH